MLQYLPPLPVQPDLYYSRKDIYRPTITLHHSYPEIDLGCPLSVPESLLPPYWASNMDPGCPCASSPLPLSNLSIKGGFSCTGLQKSVLLAPPHTVQCVFLLEHIPVMHFSITHYQQKAEETVLSDLTCEVPSHDSCSVAHRNSKTYVHVLERYQRAITIWHNV